MRILQISDTHLGTTWHTRGPSDWCRAEDHHRALRLALEPALREEVDLVIHAGDVFHRSRPPQRWMLAAGDLFREVARRVPVIGIAGNHDRRGIRRWLPHASLGFVDQPTRVVHGGVAIALVPFCREPERFLAGATQAVGGGVDLLVMHQAPHGSRVPGLTFRAGEQRDTIGAAHMPRGVRWAACGHIHPRQVVALGGTTVVCGGSTERTSFSEAHEVKGSVLWAFGRQITPTFVDHATRAMGDVPGGLVRCTPEAAEAVRARGRIAVVRGVGPPARKAHGPLFA